jgi:RNA polymerase sigma-70 factor (family 1)
MAAYSTYTDQELTVLLKDGDKNAFTELYDRYWKKLFAVATNKLRDKAVAEELAQDILGDVWQRRASINITTTFNGYLSVALKYKIIDHLARLNHRMKYETYISAHQSDEDDYTQNWLSFEELRQRLEKHVNELPEKCKVVYQMSKEQGYNNKEIALDQGITEKTVEAHLTRAMKTLRGKLGDAHFFFFF